MENDLVDVFYYDFVLSRIVELYRSNNPKNIVMHYLRVATPLCRKIRDEKRHMDREIYLKEMFIKVIQILKSIEGVQGVKNIMEEPDYIAKTLDCLDLISKDAEFFENDEDYKIIRNIGYSLYIMKKNAMGNEKSDKIEKRIISLSSIEMDKVVSIAKNFDCSKCIEKLYSVNFKKPVMIKFVKEVKDEIDKANEKKITISNDSPGDKIGWK